MRGRFYRSHDFYGPFEEGPQLFTDHMRHPAVALDGGVLSVFYSNAGDEPETILRSRIDLRGDWTKWRESPPEVVLMPELDYEGADCPHAASRRGVVFERAWQLRDPGIFREDGRTYLLYSVAGEHGIAVAEIGE
jgi:hypothetical protein